jgi:hypothetical protein
VLELYSIPIDGSAAPQKLNGSLVTGGFVFDFAISADSRRVIYRAEHQTDVMFELYSVIRVDALWHRPGQHIFEESAELCGGFGVE